MRIATWNVNRAGPRAWKRAPRIKEVLRKMDADVWVLTEAHVDLGPGDKFRSESTKLIPELHRCGERRTVIWSRYEMLQTLKTHDPQSAVCVELAVSNVPVLVYGTVLPYHGRNQKQGKEPWQAQREAIPQESEDWSDIRKKYPDHILVVAGDFNQSRDERQWSWGKWFGDEECRRLLTQALERNDLICVTEGNLTDQLPTKSTVDHICIDKRLESRKRSILAWKGESEDGVVVTDHSGVLVDLEL